MTYWMTQSLLSSWIYFRDAEDDYSDRAFQSFLSTLRREEKEPTKAMQDGIRFEDMVNAIAAGKAPEVDYNDKWAAAARRFAKKCSGGQSQVPIAGRLTVSGMDFALYGVCDYIKAGIIMDIKKVVRYSYGKYQNSPQHPMYLHLLPEANRFDYLIFTGTDCHVETYRRVDCEPIEEIILEFVHALKEYGELNTYMDFWAMDEARWQKWKEAQ